MKTLLRLFYVLIIILVFGCNKDKNEGSTNPTYTIVNNGSAGTTSISDTDDDTALDIAQAVPSVSGETYPKNIPIMFFLNDKVYLNSIEDNFIVTEAGIIIGGTIYVNEASNGYAILIFTPTKEFGAGKAIVVTLKKGIQDDGGNGLTSDYILEFTSESLSTGSFDNNKGFENGTSGVTFIGDGAILSGTHGAVSPQNGSKFGAITTGDELISYGSAVGGASSMMILGPINTSLSSLSFYYDFISAEFNEYVGSIFDDCAIVTISGPNGSYSGSIATVNTIGTGNNTQCLNFDNMPDDGDAYAGHTGWLNKTFSFNNVGTPAYIIFTVTDVSDEIYSSVLIVDNISF
jgi:hypothetical protein